eukprot:TRINITY_DN12071_c0_g3_i2.p1 TRINITY_DN12071_c0_g3~~TRINITY_DN12071_c0_g3_i2.p1  ORF type:complete len:262 (+),score=77.51 TRINITY_DN12071_c0_g3_i2:72-857(+)
MTRKFRPKTKRHKGTRAKIRDVQRLLSKDDLPETMRASQERKLAALKEQLGEEQQSKRERKMQQKYKMVKFMERRKIMRKRDALLKRLVKDGDDLPHAERIAMQQDIDQRQRWLDYIEFYPRDAKYVSVLKPTNELSDKAAKRREELIHDVAEKIASGELVRGQRLSSNKADKGVIRDEDASNDDSSANGDEQQDESLLDDFFVMDGQQQPTNDDDDDNGDEMNTGKDSIAEHETQSQTDEPKKRRNRKRSRKKKSAATNE